jgi:hypothetical protein
MGSYEMTKVYTHKLHEEVLSISGRYELDKEERLAYNGREFLYVIGDAVMDTSCCGYGAWRYAVVPGFIVSWKSGTNQQGHPISEVEPIADEKTQQEIKKLLYEVEAVNQVQFW